MKSRNTISLLSSLAFISLFFISLSLSAQTETGSNWRGPNRDGKYAETNLLKEWGENGPKMLWSYEELGSGHTSVAIDGDKIFITGMIDTTGYIYLFNKAGELQWKKEYGAEWDKNWPGPRSTPVIYQNKIVILSGPGEVICLNESDGEKIWSVNLLTKMGAKYNTWGIAENLIIHDNMIICATGSETDNVIALNIENGETIWTCKGNGEINAYCSPILINHGDRDLYISQVGQSVLCIDIKNGELLWSFPHEGNYPIHPNNPIYHEGLLFVQSAYKCGSLLLKISDDATSVEQVWENVSFDNKMGGAILLDGYIYSSADKNKGWKCIDWATGVEKFTSTELKGSGVSIFADGMLYLYSNKGIIALVKPNPDKFELVSQFDVPLGTKQHWAHPVIDNGNLYVRHGNALMVYDIRVKYPKGTGLIDKSNPQNIEASNLH